MGSLKMMGTGGLGLGLGMGMGGGGDNTNPLVTFPSFEKIERERETIDEIEHKI